MLFSHKKSSLGHYNYIFQIVWALLGGTELGLIADFSIKLSSAQKTVSLVSSKFVHRWRYHIRNWICGVAQTPYASWNHIKCNNTWGVSNTPYGSWDSKLGRTGYALCRQRVKIFSGPSTAKSAFLCRFLCKIQNNVYRVQNLLPERHCNLQWNWKKMKFKGHQDKKEGYIGNCLCEFRTKPTPQQVMNHACSHERPV
jgi:hypothetical protein